jgi:hypothetical protein
MTKDGAVKHASSEEIKKILIDNGWVEEKPKAKKPAKKDK